MFTETNDTNMSLKGDMVGIIKSNVFRSEILVALVKVIFYNPSAPSEKCVVEEFKSIIWLWYPLLIIALPFSKFCPQNCSINPGA